MAFLRDAACISRMLGPALRSTSCPRPLWPRGGSSWLGSTRGETEVLPKSPRAVPGRTELKPPDLMPRSEALPGDLGCRKGHSKLPVDWGAFVFLCFSRDPGDKLSLLYPTMPCTSQGPWWSLQRESSRPPATRSWLWASFFLYPPAPHDQE